MTPNLRHALRLLGFVSLAALAACDPQPPKPSPLYKTDARLIFPLTASMPAIDGDDGDPAWTGAFHYLMEDGAPLPAADLRGVYNADNVYLYMEVEDNAFNEEDAVVIALNPDNANGNYRRIHIFPCLPSAGCAASGTGQHATIQYWTGTPGGPGGQAFAWTEQPLPVGLIASTGTSTAGPTRKWSIEVAIPRAAFGLVDTNYFGLFVDVISADPDAGVAGVATQYTWPTGQFIGGADENDVLSDLETGTLPASAWGNATLSTAFGNGVSVYADEIGSNHPTDDSQMILGDGNTFHASAINNSSSGGTLVEAKSVTATFKIANFGLPNAWANVPPPGGNPVGPVNIPAAGAHRYETGIWNLTPQEITDYTANLHQCIRVDLSSSDPSTVIVNGSAQRNMDFVTANSPIQAMATIGGKRSERGGDYLLTESFSNFDPNLTWQTRIKGAEPIGPARYIVKARPGQDLPLGIMVDTNKELRLPSQDIRIAPGTGSPKQPAQIVEVRGGDLITLIAEGGIEIDGHKIGADGLSPTQLRQMKVNPRDGKFRDGTGDLTGALIGSFDGFQTTFVVGNAATLKVPAGAKELSLAINDVESGYATQKGEGLGVQIIATPLDKFMLATNPALARETKGRDVFVPLGSNLPTWTMRGSQNTGRVLKVGKRPMQVYQPVGSFAYLLRRIGVKQ